MASIFAKLQRTACQKSDLLLILILYYVMTGHDRLIYVIMARDLFDSMCLPFSFDLPMARTYSEVRGVRCFTGGFLLGGSLGYVAVWESDDGGEGESMKSVEEEYRLSTAAKAGNPNWTKCPFWLLKSAPPFNACWHSFDDFNTIVILHRSL